MEGSLSCFLVCFVLLIVSLCAQIAGIASDSWLVLDMTMLSESYNFGLYYVSYCQDNDNCDTYYIRDLPKANPLGIGNIALDKIFTVYRVGTALAAVLTFVGIIFVSGLTIGSCASCQKCTGYYNHLTCLHCVTLAGGLLAISEAAHYGTEIHARSEGNDNFGVPYSIILTGIGGVLAIVAFFILTIISCMENNKKEEMIVGKKTVVPERKFIPPKEYFQNAEPYVQNHPPAPQKEPPAPSHQPSRDIPDGPPSYASSRTYSDFLAEKPRKVEYIELPTNSTTYREGRTYRDPSQSYHIAQAEPNVYHITLR